jgi:type II secretory pathway component GspD/PulD (secretin)
VLGGNLIVNQTPENHRALQGLLEQLRESQSIQITIEARFLTVQRNFLEDIGVDVDFIFNADADANDKWSPIPVNNNSAVFTANPITGIPGSIGNVAPTTIDPEDPLSVGVGALACRARTSTTSRSRSSSVPRRHCRTRRSSPHRASR